MRRSPKPKDKALISCWRVTPTPIELESPFPRPAIPSGEWTVLDGNQIGVLLAAFVMKETEALGKVAVRPLSGYDFGLEPDGTVARPA